VKVYGSLARCCILLFSYIHFGEKTARKERRLYGRGCKEGSIWPVRCYLHLEATEAKKQKKENLFYPKARNHLVWNIWTKIGKRSRYILENVLKRVLFLQSIFQFAQ